jgi:uncharacterized RDD family membrane protein YckC
VDSPAPISDEQFAEWYVWAKREISTDNRVCLGAAQAAVTALSSGASQDEARVAARRSIAGHGIGLVGDVSPRRRAYAEWYDWARRELGGGSERLHAATNAAMDALDRGADAEAAAVSARERATPLGPEPGPTTSEPGLVVPAVASPPTDAPPTSPAPDIAPTGVLPQAPTTPIPSPQPAALQGVPSAPSVPRHAYAGFWRRTAAYLIDLGLLVVTGIVLAFIVSFFVVLGLLSNGQATQDNFDKVSVGLYLLAFVLSWLYFAGLESSPWQATIGKRALRLLVTDVTGRRISFGRATARYFAKILSLLTAAAGFWMIPLMQRRQGLHDLIAGTTVVRRELLSLVSAPGLVHQAQTHGTTTAAGAVQGAKFPGA